MLFLSFRVSINSSRSRRAHSASLLTPGLLLGSSPYVLSLSLSPLDVHLPQGQLCVDDLVVVVLRLHTGQQGPDAPEREGRDGLGALRQELEAITAITAVVAWVPSVRNSSSS